MNGISCLNAENGVCKTILASYWKTSEKKLATGENFCLTGVISAHTNTEIPTNSEEKRRGLEWEKK